MKMNVLRSAPALLALLVLAYPACCLGQRRGSTRLTGVLNDYTPSTVSGGPWEMHGQWSMDVHGERDTADFYADMTMSDFTTSSVDPIEAGQNPHTHHIRLTNVKVTWDMIGCPTYSPPTTTGFQITGTVSLITGNGGMAPFETSPPSSVLQVCITGGTDVADSNLTMVFSGPATKHFGTQGIHGVVRKAEPLDRDR